uniref:SWAP70 N-terminal EF-hand domain-containing protein n=1 Tax=Buteo japonicus TaxID=224669 RepID=A0A8B9Z6E6_9AVES
MGTVAELLKSIWYAFTALDVEKSGKVSKSQLKVLSHNLYTVLCIPHDPVALEEHFRDDDDGPVSSQGYMPYLNKYILDKVSPLGIPLTCCVSGGDTTVPGLLLHPVAAPRLHSPLLLEIPCLDGWKKDTEGWGALR